MPKTLSPVRRWRQLLIALPLPVLLVAVDLMVRGRSLGKLPPDFKAYYAASLLFGAFFWYGLLTWIKGATIRRPAIGIGLAAGTALAFTITVFGAYAFFDHFAALPNLFAFEYIIDEPSDCWIYARAAMEPLYLVVLVTATTGLGAYLIHAARRPEVAASKWDLAGTAFGLVAAALFFNNNVRMGPNAFTPDVHTFFSLTKAAEFAVTGDREVAVVSAGARARIDAGLGPLPHHVLLILNESMRAKSLSAYGYFRNTTPNLKAFFEHRSANIVRFDRAYANATRTMLAFPSFFTGIIPSQTGGLLHRVPLVFDYGRAFANASTFLISTQSMHWGNFDKFLDTQRLDFSWYKENSEYAHTEADRFESLDDKYLPDAFKRYLDGRDKNKKIFGVIQLTNTHAPYGFDKEDDVFHDDRLTNYYDNSLHYHDRQMARILKELDDHGLLKDTLIISTSDHGEAFGEHGYYGHLNTFYDEEARVPLWVHLPDQLAKAKDVVAQLRRNARDSVSNADVIPTLMSLLTRDRFKNVQPYLVDLPGAPLDRTLPANRGILMQNYNDIDGKTMFVGLGMVVGKYKYLLKFNNAAGEEELYDLEADPREEHNVWSKASVQVKQVIYWNIMRHKNSKDLFRKAFPDRVGHT